MAACGHKMSNVFVRVIIVVKRFLVPVKFCHLAEFDSRHLHHFIEKPA
jgi:hypothetical protein